MNQSLFRWQSLITRINLFTLLIFVTGIGALAVFAGLLLRQDMERLSGEQQFSTASFMGDAVNQQLRDRFKALDTVAAIVSPVLQGKPADVQASLAQLEIFQQLFNGGTFVTGLDGMVIAASPPTVAHIGQAYGDRDYIQGALQSGKATVGHPLLAPKAKAPAFGMSTPIRDAQGKVIGVLAGIVDLNQPNFLDQISETRYAKSGGYFIVEPSSRRIVTSSDKRRIMEVLPAPGISPWIDRFMTGYEGPAVVTNPLGIEVLVSVKQLPAVGWYLSVILPTRDAFAPIYDMQRRILVAAVLLAVLASALTRWMLKRQLAPIHNAAQALALQSDAPHALRPLPITRPDEIGQLIAGFNRLLETLRQRDEALRANEVRLRCLSDMSSDFYWETDAEHRITQRTESRRETAEMVFLHTPSVGARPWEIAYLAPNETGWQAHRDLLDAHSPFRHFEICRARDNGSVHHISLSGDPMFDPEGNFTGYQGIGTDITAQKLAEEAQRIAATAFETQQGMLVTNTDWEILRVNKAFTEITGYSAREAIGQTPQLLRSGYHDDAFYAAMADCIALTGSWAGEVWDRRKNGDLIPLWLTITGVKDDAGQITHYVDTFTDITSRKAAETQIRSLAFFDPLTGLPNRRLLMDRLKQALATHSRHLRKGALLFVDLDNFKTLNDTRGHDIGDLLLQQVAQRLSTCIREGDTVARLGGDEFVVMLEDLSENPLEAINQAKTVGEKILATLNQNYPLGSHIHNSTPSIGVTLFGEHPESLEEPMKRADLAMYQAKAAGRNAMRFFDPDMQTVATARAALQVSLAEAVENQQFLLYYQAQVDGAYHLTGVEALVRWQHPQHGLVPPAEFIPLAEESGIIVRLGQWILETACRQLAQWATQADMAHLTMAVNVSPRQFNQPDFVDQVLAVLDRTGIDPQRLKLELTEGMLVSNVEDVIAKMNALKGRRVGFSLDDFGTGYSSLSHLKRLPLTQLKIDQGFVRDILVDPNDAAIAKMVIALGDSLGLTVIAEGVETEAQRDFLAQLGCHAYQGYFFSRPLPITEFEVFAASGPHRLV